MSARLTVADALATLATFRDALATPQGARLGREIRALLARADEAHNDGDTYAARIVARAFARAEARPPSRARSTPSSRNTRGKETR